MKSPTRRAIVELDAMGQIIWYVGRGFQVLGLMTTGFALMSGFKTHDSRTELMLMCVGVLEFGAGLFFLRKSQGGS